MYDLLIPRFLHVMTALLFSAVRLIKFIFLSFQSNPNYHQEKSRCEYLHNKLAHIKKLISEYDQQQLSVEQSSCNWTADSWTQCTIIPPRQGRFTLLNWNRWTSRLNVVSQDLLEMSKGSWVFLWRTTVVRWEKAALWYEILPQKSRSFFDRMVRPMSCCHGDVMLPRTQRGAIVLQRLLMLKVSLKNCNQTHVEMRCNACKHL